MLDDRAGIPVPRLSPAAAASVNVLLVAGPLGSGKTTFINGLVKELDRFVVIENDAGGANVDASIIRAPADKVVTMTAGCICCDDPETLMTAVTRLAVRQARSGEGPLVVPVEPSGLADAGVLAGALSRRGVPHAVVAVCDAANFARNELLGLGKGSLAEADVVLVTKSGGLPPEGLASVLAEVGRRAPAAPVYLLDQAGRSPGLGVDSLLSAVELPAPAAPLLRVTDAAAGSEPPSHGLSVETFVLGRSVTEADLREATRTAGVDVVRLKGYCDGALVQFVHGEWSVSSVDRTDTLPFVNVFVTGPDALEPFRRLAHAPAEVPPGAGPADRAAEAAAFLREAAASYPGRLLTDDGRLLVEYAADQGWLYALDPSVDEKARLAFFDANVRTRLLAVGHLERDVSDDDPAAPYYRMRLGSDLGYLAHAHPDVLDRLGLARAVAAAGPGSLFYSGLAGVVDPLQLRSVKEEDLPHLLGLARLAEREIGPGLTAELVEAGVLNAGHVSADGSWRDPGVRGALL